MRTHTTNLLLGLLATFWVPGETELTTVSPAAHQLDRHLRESILVENDSSPRVSYADAKLNVARLKERRLKGIFSEALVRALPVPCDSQGTPIMTPEIERLSRALQQAVEDAEILDVL
jgi:CBS domain-containing protein